MDMTTVNPDVQRAVAAARPRPPNYIPYIVKWLFAHGYLIAVLPIIVPVFLIRALIPNRKRLTQWSVRQAFDVFLIRYVLKVLTAVHFQPLPPREHGLRENRGLVGSTLSFLNQSGPGGLAASLVVPAVEEVEEVAKYGNLSTDWFAPAPLHAFRGILSIKTPKNAGTPVSESETYKHPPLLEPKWANLRTKGYWFMQHHKPKPKPGAPGAQSRPVMLYMHGGACVTMAANDLFMGQLLTNNLAQKAQIDIFSIDYLLAPHAPVPVQLSQALAAYLFLIGHYGYEPAQIFIGGDSYGAHLALQLERFLRTDGAYLTKSALRRADSASGCPGLLLLSPWVMAAPIDTPSRSAGGKGELFDIAFIGYINWGLDAMRLAQDRKDRLPIPLEDPWVSPLLLPAHELQTMAPIFLNIGEVEALYDEDMGFVEKVRNANGNITVHKGKNCPHDYGTMWAFAPNFAEMAQDVGSWLLKRQT